MRKVPSFFLSPTHGRDFIRNVVGSLVPSSVGKMASAASAAGAPAQIAAELPQAQAAAAAAAGSSAVRFVAVPGSGLEEAFPRLRNLSSGSGTALSPNGGRPKTFISAAADLSLGTESPSVSGTLVADANGGGVRAATASTSTQAPELKLSDWVSARSRRGDEFRTFTCCSVYSEPYKVVAVVAPADCVD